MGGSGTTGTIGFPAYVEAFHQLYLVGATGTPTSLTLTSYVDDVLEAALSGSSPYSGSPFTDPQSTDFMDLDELVTDVGAFETFIGTKQAATSIDTFVDQMVTTLDTSGVLNAIASQVSQANTDAGTVNTSAGSASPLSAYSHTTDYEAIVTQALDNVDNDMSLEDIDIADIVTRCLTESTRIFDNSVADAQAAADDAVIAELITAFDANRDYSRSESLGRYKATMADGHATFGSSFLIGLSLLNAQHARDASNFAATTKQSLFQAALGAHLQMSVDYISRDAQIEMGEKQSREQLIAQAIEIMTRLESGSWTADAQYRQVYTQIFAENFRNHLNARIAEKNSRDTLIAQGAGLQGQLEQLYVNMRNDSVRLRAEVSRIGYLILNEYEGSVVDLTERDAKWDWEAFTWATNILTGPAGMTATLPNKPSRVANALGGAIGGAGVGASFGAPGAAIGGLLGGIGGLLS